MRVIARRFILIIKQHYVSYVTGALPTLNSLKGSRLAWQQPPIRSRERGTSMVSVTDDYLFYVFGSRTFFFIFLCRNDSHFSLVSKLNLEIYSY